MGDGEPERGRPPGAHHGPPERGTGDPDPLVVQREGAPRATRPHSVSGATGAGGPRAWHWAGYPDFAEWDHSGSAGGPVRAMAAGGSASPGPTGRVAAAAGRGTAGPTGCPSTRVPALLAPMLPGCSAGQRPVPVPVPVLAGPTRTAATRGRPRTLGGPGAAPRGTAASWADARCASTSTRVSGVCTCLSRVHMCISLALACQRRACLSDVYTSAMCMCMSQPCAHVYKTCACMSKTCVSVSAVYTSQPCARTSQPCVCMSQPCAHVSQPCVPLRSSVPTSIFVTMKEEAIMFIKLYQGSITAIGSW